jgi:hypothetical protein
LSLPLQSVTIFGAKLETGAMARNQAFFKETEMGHAVRIRSREQYIEALRVLDRMPGTWRGIGPASDPVLLLTEAQYNALVKAGVVPSSDKKVQSRGKKAVAKKTKS